MFLGMDCQTEIYIGKRNFCLPLYAIADSLLPQPAVTGSLPPQLALVGVRPPQLIAARRSPPRRCPPAAPLSFIRSF